MVNFYKTNRDYINKVLYIMLFFLVVYVSIKFLLPFVAPFVFGYLFALCANPAVTYIAKKCKMHRGIATAIIMLLFILLLGLLINLIAVNVVRQAHGFANALPEYAKEVSDRVQELESRYNSFFEFMPDNVQSLLRSAAGSLEQRATDIMGNLLQIGGGELIKTIPTAVLGILLWFVSSFFFTKDKHVIEKFLKDKIPATIAEGYHSGMKRAVTALKGWAKAQLTIMSIIAVIAVAGLFLMKYPYALLVGIIISFIDVLPLFGSGFVLIPWAILSALTGNFTRMISLLALNLAILLARQLLEPKILGSQLGIHPILILMSIFIGLRLFGVFGIIIGPISVVMAVGLFMGDKVKE